MKKILIATGIICKKNKILLVKHKKKFKNMWSVPGGRVEDDESILEALRHEVFEETGMKVVSEYPLGFFELKLDNKNLIFFVFECKVSGKFSENKEIKDFKWTDIDKIKDFNLKPGMENILNFTKGKE